MTVQEGQAKSGTMPGRGGELHVDVLFPLAEKNCCFLGPLAVKAMVTRPHALASSGRGSNRLGVVRAMPDVVPTSSVLCALAWVRALS